MNSALIVLTTCPNAAEAKQLASGLVESQLAACVQLKAISSIYHWQGELQQDEEIQLMIKTTQERYLAIEQYIKQQHSYELPEIIALPIHTGSAEYLQWLNSRA